jgi:hypothetical protein
MNSFFLSLEVYTFLDLIWRKLHALCLCVIKKSIRDIMVSPWLYIRMYGPAVRLSSPYVRSAMAATATPVLREEKSPLCVCDEYPRCFVFLILLILMIMTLCFSEGKVPLEYSVAITGASGLGPVTDLPQGRGLLHPEFNLTIGITSRSSSLQGRVHPNPTRPSRCPTRTSASSWPAGERRRRVWGRGNPSSHAWSPRQGTT